MPSIPAKIRPIPFQKLYSCSGKDSYKDQQAVRQAVRQNGHTALALIHPLYSIPLIRHPDRISRNHHIQQKITWNRYRSYLGRLNQHLAQTTLPIFIFHEGINTNKAQIDQIVNWLSKVGIKNPVITIPTGKADPTPTIPEIVSGDLGWEFLARTLAMVEVSQLKLMGEVFFRVNTEKIGCVPYTSEKLSSIFGNLGLEIIPQLTFPNVLGFGSN
jgi:hypothetical protein